MPAALAWDAGRALWRGWGRIALGLDALLALVMWPLERTADAMAWGLRTGARVLHVAMLVRWASTTFDRLLAPVERVLRRIGTRLMRIVRRIGWIVSDLFAPITRPVARVAGVVRRAAAACMRVASRRIAAARALLAAALQPARRALRTALLIVRRRPR